MDLTKYGFTTSSSKAKRKKSEEDVKEKKKTYEEKRKRAFISTWLEEFPGLVHEKSTATEDISDETSHDIMACKTCRDFSELADQSSSMFKGTSKFRKDTLIAHWKSETHIKCEDRLKLLKKAELHSPCQGTSKSETATTSELLSNVGPIVDIFKRVDQETTEKLKKLLTTVYFLCKNEMPFTDYPKLLLLQEINGLDVGHFYRSDNACRRFVKHIHGDLLNQSLKKLKDKKFFSILIDGATDSSVTENELIYVRYVNHGIPVNHYLSIEDLQSADAEGILSSINKAFERNNFENWKEKLIGFGSDGASVNLGKRGGVATLIKEDVEHLVITHCVAHRLELAANNAIKHHKIMKDLQDLLQRVYKHYHYSPKALRELRDIGEALEHKVLKPANLGGTRWLPHINKALEILNNNFTVILSHFEHIVSSRSGSAEVQGRAHFVSMKLKDYKFLYMTFFILDILNCLSDLSLKLQRDGLTLSQMLDALTTTHLSLVEMKTVDGSVLSDFITSVNDSKFKGIDLKNLQANEQFTIQKLEILELVSDALDVRFRQMEKDSVIQAAVKCLGLNEYPSDIETLATFGNEDVSLLLEHFHDILERNECDFVAIKKEWKDFKAYVFRHHPSIENIFILPDLLARFKNLVLLMEILLSFPLSSAACERGFSAMKRIKSDWRSSLTPEMLRMLMYIVIEGPSEHEFNSVSVVNRWWTTGRSKRPGYNPFDFRQRPEPEDSDPESDN